MRVVLRILHLFGQPLSKKKMVVEAALGLTYFKAKSLILPFRKFSKALGDTCIEFPEDDVVLPECLKDIRWAVNRGGILAPWGKKCLIQTVTAKWMAAKRGYKTTSFLGVGKGEDNQFIYHAWLKYHKYLITGGKVEGVYKTLSTFR